jgi:cytosine/adenosine deaminase-related metal-dependent hydrolase
LEGRECAAPSLHAPYTVAPGLFDVAARWCAQEGRPLAIHAAETQEEQRLLATGDGPLAEFLRAVGTGPPFSAPPRTGAVEYLERLGALGARTNLIHANYVSDAEIEAIARSGASVVVCPGSYAYFGHRGHRVRDMLAAGVRVALGTDSWASNTDLDMRLEMKRAREEHGLDAWTVFRMATENGAQALFPGERLGVLEPGCQADMTVLDARNVRPEGVADWVTAFRPRVIATIVRGRIAYGARRGFTVPVR